MARYESRFTAEDIDRRLGDVDKKAGLFYYDSTNNRYLVFTNETARDEYLEDPSKVELIIGTFDAPFNYSAKIVLETKAYNAVALGSTGHFLDFTFDIENKNGQSTGENIICTYTFRKGSVKQTVVEQYAAGRSVHFSIDKYLSEGTNNITIAIQGVTSLAATTAAITFQVVNLNISTRYDISNAYNLSTGAKTMEIPFAVSGYGTKTVEWYVDGVLLPFVKDEDEVVDSSVERTKYITLNNMSQGSHSLQLRAYTVVNGESFYTDTLYRDFMVYTASNSNPIVAVAVTIPKEHGVLGVNDAVSIYNMVQYVPYVLEFATYSPSNASSLDVEIWLDDESKGGVQSSNSMVNSFSLVSKTSGNKNLKIKVGDLEYVIPAKVKETEMKLQEITNNLVLSFDALGRSNNNSNRSEWTDGEHAGTLTGFNWNNTSGWVNDRLEMNAGSSFAINLAPLAGKPTAEGKTIELEWSTKNVHDDNAVICDLRENGVGVCIYATKVSMTSADGVVIETEYKSDENVRIAFVINRAENATNKGLSFIYANGIVSRADNWAVSDSYESNANIHFTATEDAEVSLKSIRIYNAALSNDQILNNYILYRDTVEEMTEVYDRNDVYADGTSVFDPERMMGRLPVMIVTGDIPTLENTSDKDTQITVDVEYINMQDRSLSFTMKNAAMRPQGTSSMGYPKKNFRIYTQKVYNTQLFDANGNEVADKLYAFKHGSQPVDCWCLKADYAESSGTHNTGIARLWNEALFNAQIEYKNILGETTDGYALRTNAQQIALMSGYPYDVRTTIDGFPILLFYRPSVDDELIFIGKYNFNNDKSTESVFGFKGIPNFDNSKVQCWEILNNGNALALFNTMEGFDENWSEVYESRYPDTKTPYLGDLKAFSEWMTTVTMERFATEKWAHLDIYKMAAYWCYLMRHAGADQFVKNAMFTSEDGQHFYFILYDNDTINGLINSGRLKIKPTDTRQTVNEAGDYVFAGHDSRLWNMLEADSEFNQIVSVVDNALYSSGISYQNTIRIFDNEQADKWVERVYNQDAQYKYVSPYVEKGVDNLFMLQGKRDLHRKWWLSKRFAIYDAKYVSGTYKSQAIEIKCENAPIGQQFTITSGYPISYGYGINTLPREFGIELAVGESYTFATREVVNIGDPIRIYGAPNIAGLDLSKMVDTIREITIAQVYDEAQGTKLTKLIVGGKPNYSVTGISGLGVATALEYIDVSGLLNMVNLDLNNHQYIKTVKAKGSGIASITFAKGAPVELLELPAAIRILTLEQLPYLTTGGLDFEDLSSVQGISIKSCPNLSNDYALIKEWMSVKTTDSSRCSIVMDNVNWEGVSGAEIAAIAQLGTASLKGRIKLTDLTEAQGAILTSVFGDTIYDPNAELYIDAPITFRIVGQSSLLEGQNTTFSWSVFPRVEGVVEFSLANYRPGCSITKDGVLTTEEVGDNTSTLQVKAVFTSSILDVVLEDIKSIEVVKRTYPTNISINGEGNLKVNTEFSWSSTTPEENINGGYYAEWSVGGNIASYYSVHVNEGGYCELHQNLTPPTNMTGTLSVVLKKVVDNSIVASATKEISFSYIYPSVVTVSGKTTVQGGVSEEYIAVVTPSNVDIGITYTWSVSGSSNVFIESSNGATCVLGSNTPDQEETFTLTCTVKSLDNKVTVSGNFTGTLQTRPNFITATYNVTTTSSTTNLFGNTSVSYMEVDGVEVGATNRYKFSTTGEHTVRFSTRSMSSLFSSISALKSVDFSECNGSLFNALNQAFSSCSKLESINWGNCTFPNITNFSYAFSGCSSLTSIDLTPFTGAPITSLSESFRGCSSLTSIDLTPFTGAPITNLQSAFYRCTSLTSINFEGCLLPSVTNLYETFSSCSSLTSINFEGCLLPSVTKLDSTFSYCSSLTSIDLTPFTGAPITSLSQTFRDCSSLTSINLVGCLFPNVKNLDYVFSGCKSLTSIDLTPFTGAPITSLSESFYGCKSLTSIDLTSFTGAPITSLSSTFYGCSSLTSIDLTPFTGAPITSLSSTFYNCLELTSINLTPFTGAPITSLGSTFYGCSSLTSIDLTSFTGAPITSLSSTFRDCSSLTSIDLTPFTGAPIKNLSSTFRYCLSLTSIDLTPFTGAPITSLGSTFERCSSLTSIDLTPLSGSQITSWNATFNYCKKLSTIILAWDEAPSINYDTFGNNYGAYTGQESNSSGVNTLLVPYGATGYDSGYWLDPLQNAQKCGFTLKYSYEPTECTSLTILADDVIGNNTTTKIYWTAITNGINSMTGEDMTGIEVSGIATSESFPQNTSETETVEREISFTYMGVTATTTIIQGVWINASYTINMNSQWQPSTVANPDSTLYDGVYESFSNKGKPNTAATMYIDIVGYSSFSLYIRSYAEGAYDYVMVSQLDQSINNNTSYTNSTLVKANTYSNQHSGTSISDYTLVEFTDIDGLEHRITIVYRKDGSSDSGDDRGYVLIPKNQ